jgi:hypothetical protein
MQMGKAEDPAKVTLRVDYPEEPGLGALAYDLLELDRGFRSALGEARSGRPPDEHWAWPRLTESPRVVRASANSPLAIEAAGVVAAAVGTVIGELIVAAIQSRFSKRSSESQAVQVTINVENNQDNRKYVFVVDGNRVIREELLSDRESSGSDQEAEG